MPPERLERLSSLPLDEIPQEPLCAYAVLYMVTRALCGWKQLPKFVYNRYGKPSFDGYPDLQFNISHTRGAILIGLHSQPIGVDIERIRPVSERTMQRIAGTATRREFFESWVRRESRSKWNGAGLGTLMEKESPALKNERIVFLDTFPEYAACVCTHSADRVAKVRTFTIT